MKEFLINHPIIERALKTFIEVFIVTFVGKIIPILNDISSVNWADWQTWLMPIVCACLGTALSVSINGVEALINSKKEEEK